MQDDRKQAKKIVEFLTLRQEQMATLEEAMERTRHEIGDALLEAEKLNVRPRELVTMGVPMKEQTIRNQRNAARKRLNAAREQMAQRETNKAKGN